MSDVRNREWCFTVFNYDDIFVDYLKTLKPRYLVVGFEVSPTTGNLHLQCYVCFQNAKTFSSVKKYFECDNMHLEVKSKYSTSKQASDYCKKEGNFYEYGELPKQGKRTDLDNVMDVVRETGSMREVVNVATSYQSTRMAELWLKYHDKPRDRKEPVYVWWFYGKSGTGKTTSAHTFLESLGKGQVYSAGDIGKWFDGYDGHQCVLFDELRPDNFNFKSLLKYLDRDAVKVETKGGSRQFRARYIVITTPYSYKEFVPHGEDPYQLERRIYQQIKFERLSDSIIINPPQEANGGGAMRVSQIGHDVH